MVGTDKSVNVTGDEVWGLDAFPSPIQLTASLSIVDGATVTITPGCRIVAMGPYTLTVGGAIRAGGEPRGRIVFQSAARSRGAWGGLAWTQDGADDTVLQRVDLLDALKGVDLGTPTTGRVRMADVRVENCDVGLSGKLEYLVSSDLLVQRNRIGIVSTSSWGADALIHGRIRWNDLGLSHAGVGMTLALSDQGIRIHGNAKGATITSGTFNAEGVWWGADDGPDGGGVTGHGDVIDGAGAIDVSPWTELGLYCTADEVRVYCSRILRERGSAGLDDPESALTDDELEAIIGRAMDTVDGFFTDASLDKPLFARGTETNEEVDAVSWYGSRYYRLRYWPIRAVSTVEIRSGASWSSLSEEEWNGWWASDELKRDGRVRIGAAPRSPVSPFRVTYDHGYDVLPQGIRDLAVKVAAAEVLSSILPAGATDTIDPRVRRITEELSAAAKQYRGRKVGWST